MTGILDHISKNIPADQLFLHLDRNLYHPGDTVRFQAYIRDSQTGVIETKSISLYALLLNSNHATIDSARFRIIYSTASGWLKIPEAVTPGDYSILAFTSSNMNFNPEFSFTTPVRIDHIRPVRIESETQIKSGDTLLYEMPLPQSTIDLRFLPEGGTFIYGINQRLAFNAVTSTGVGLDVTGIIKNQRGEKITEFRSTTYGPGVVEFTPLPGDTYFAALNGKEFNGLSWPLPIPERSGVAMQVNNAGKGLIDIILKGRETDGMAGFLTVTMNNVLIFSEEIHLDTLFKARISTKEIPSGTAFVTLYDKDLNPLAERMIFLNENKKLNVTLGVSSKIVDHVDETELTINTTDYHGNNISSVVSVSVIDSATGYDCRIPLPEIESVYLYDREFYNNLPSRIKSLGLKNIDSKSINILMMTYGWRKFNLKEITRNNPEKEFVNYDCLTLNRQGAVKKRRSEIELISLEEGKIINLEMNNSREAVLPFDSLDIYTRQVMILTEDDSKKNINPVSVRFPENKNFTDNAKHLVKDYSYSAPYLPPITNRQPDFDVDTSIMIESVTIKAPQQPVKVYVDKYEKMYQSYGVQTMYSKDFITASTFEDILPRFSPFYLDRRNKKIILRAVKYFFTRGYVPALFVVDNAPIYDNTYVPIAQMPSSEIASVSVLRGPQGFAIFGNEAVGGVVFVTTKTGNKINGGADPADESGTDDDIIKPVRLFRTETEYYIPTKEEVFFIPEFQSRPTILWKTDVFIDSTGSVKIKYPNNLIKSTAMILVNGVTFTNLVGSNRYIYKVKQPW
ncbi:MAG TPA: hypothetical protein PLR88_10210 [Bacteroidales bacterium]|nr:hypothetical protein [Bacteroidales bacterium]